MIDRDPGTGGTLLQVGEKLPFTAFHSTAFHCLSPRPCCCRWGAERDNCRSPPFTAFHRLSPPFTAALLLQGAFPLDFAARQLVGDHGVRTVIKRRLSLAFHCLPSTVHCLSLTFHGLHMPFSQSTDALAPRPIETPPTQ